MLAQRYVDRLRAQRRFEPLPDDELDTGIEVRAGGFAADRGEPPDPDRARYVGLVRQALGCAVGRLAARDRLRLASYYVQELTLAETGRVLKEHEATVSRQLARTRRVIRSAVERQLRDEAGLNDDQVAACFEWVAGDPGSLDLKKVIYE